MSDILGDILRLQEEIRILEQQSTLDEQRQPESSAIHRRVTDEGDSVDIRGKSYEDTSPASIPFGTFLVKGPENDDGYEPWADHPRPLEPGDLPALQRIGCADGADCLDENFCYGDYDCGECEACYGNSCRDIDVFAPCFPGDKRPCPPTPEQRYDCLDPSWRWWDECTFDYNSTSFSCHEPDGSRNWHLTCRQNEDCGPGEVCDNRHFYCVPACTIDAQCDPNHPQRAGDARTGSYCVSGECTTPCDPPRFCTPETESSDCEPGEYCEERQGRVASDPTGIRSAYQCVGGCREDSNCLAGESCVDNSCVRVCSGDGDCNQAEGEGCVEGRCESVGGICISDSDCGSGQYCNGDGRCTGGCRSDAECSEECTQDQACIDACPADPTCICTCPEGEEFCDECPEDFSWLDNCPRDPDCVRQCPIDQDCLGRQQAGATCVDGTCAVACSTTNDCPNGYGCVDGKCAKATTGAETRVECVDVEICGQIIGEDGEPTGETGCYFEERCTTITINPPIDSAIYSCGCAELCDQEGQCAPAICSLDSDCEACSYCGPEGICIPGCDSENPCPSNECCGPDGKCHNKCSSDGDCPDPEVCLSGCCGIACDPIILCSTNDQCPDGQYCDQGVCQSGCANDNDCLADEVCRQGNCSLSCNSDADCSGDICVNGACEAAPDPPCQNDSSCGEGSICSGGTCKSGCRTDSNCPGSAVCRAGTCATRCSGYEECIALDAGNVCDDGFCVQVGGGSGGGGANEPGARTGCECFETCDDMGRCITQKCTTANDCDCGTCLSSGLCGFCERDQDCPNNMLCVDGECLYPCIPETDCSSDADCSGDGFYCDQARGTCQPGCSSDAGCGPGQVCRDNSCAPTCSGDEACADDESCINGACVYTGLTCTDDVDCYSGYCLNGYCAEDVRCSTNDDCGSGLACVNNSCVRQSTCFGHSDCKTSEFCVDGTCSPNAYCNSTADCDGGLVCHDNRCKNGQLCTSDLECSPSEFCDQGFCAQDIRCLSDGDCATDEVCTQGFCASAPNKDVPASIGCESCNDVCSPDFTCVPIKCSSDDDCNCGFCGSRGECIDECQKDEDCPDGYCIGGECIECKTDAHCQTKYGKDSLVCNDGVCDTPCFTGLSTGDCSSGLRLGDTCTVCPDKCPGGAGQCQEGSLSCGTVQYIDPEDGKVKYKAAPCKICLQTCSTAADCGEGYACYDGQCVTRGDKCVVDTDCEEGDYCFGFTCTTSAGNCFAASDCEPTERCVDGECRSVEGSVTESDGNLVCPRGQVQRNGQCILACDTAFMYCKASEGELGSPAVPCPEGYTCNSKLNRCTRDGYYGIGDIMGCPTGTFCCEGGCVDYRAGERECCADDDCAEGKVCISPRQSAPGIAICRAPGWDGTVQDAQQETAAQLKAARDAARATYNDALLAYNSAKQVYDRAFALPEADLSKPQQLFDAEQALTAAEDTLDTAEADLNAYDSQWNAYTPQPYVDDAGGEGDGVAQDNCEAEGKCCGDDGFCTDCPCNEENPCPGQQCCDPISGVCMDRSEHPATELGAPGRCSYGEVFCEINDCDGNPFDPATQFGGRGYEWCEEITNDDPVPVRTPHPTLPDVTIITYEPSSTVEVKCYKDGDKVSKSQIRTLLESYCACPSEEEDCSCDAAEGAEQCVNDGDCSDCQRCVTRYQTTDSCCGYFYETGDGEIHSGVVTSVCEARSQYDDCECQTDADCTECERCVSRAIGGNTCEPACEELCPCGGDTSNGQGCPTCAEKYGACAREETGEVEPSYVDQDTGEIIPAKTVCTCGINYENLCCEAYTQPIIECTPTTGGQNCVERAATVEDMAGRDGCIEKTYTDSNGTKRYEQVAYCADFDAGMCAGCIKDAQCPGTSVCLNYQCVTECGQEDSLGGGGQTRSELVPAEDCSCCTDQGECKALYEAWTESREAGEGSECRPCECTENGIDCKTYENCDGCYLWERVDGSSGGGGAGEGFVKVYDEIAESKATAQRLEIEEQVLKLEQQKEEAALAVPEFAQARIDASAEQQEAELAVEQECDHDILGTPSSECLEAQQKLSQANAAYQQADANARAAEDQLDAIQSTIDDLTSQSQVSFQQGEWRRVKQCDCCMDGLCRPEDDCAYGICYTCVDTSDPERAANYGKYRGALYNHVKSKYGFWQLTCTGTVDEFIENPETYATAIEGQNVFYWTPDTDACVKYKCEDGLSFYQGMGGGVLNNKYFEYCTGSIISCALSGSTPEKREQIKKEYSQGWDFEMDFSDVGTFVGNHTLPQDSWIKISGPTSSATNVTTSCRYPNPNAHVRAHTLPTFSDIVYTHECCSSSIIAYECDPEYPRCQLAWETIYESGDPENLINRLERDIQVMSEGLAKYEQQIAEVQAKIDEKKAERDQIQQVYDQAAADYNSLKSRKDSLTSEITRLEERLKTEEVRINGDGEGTEKTRSVIGRECEEKEAPLLGGLSCRNINLEYEWEDDGSLQSKVDEAQAKYDVILSYRNDWLSQRDQYDAEKESISGTYDVAITNRDNASAAAKDANKELEKLKLELQELQGLLDTLPPGTVEYDQAEIDFLNKEAEVDAQQGVVDNLEGDVDSYTEEAGDLADELNRARLNATDANEQLQYAQQLLDNANGALNEARLARLEGQQDYVQIQNDLMAKNQELTQVNEELDALGRDVSFEVCSWATGVEVCETTSEGNYEQQINLLSDAIIDLEDSLEGLNIEKAELAEDLADANAELARLEEESDRPQVPELVPHPGTGDNLQTSEQLRERYKEMRDQAKEEAAKSWWPD